MKTRRLFLLGLTAVFAAACVQGQAENPQAALPEGEVIEDPEDQEEEVIDETPKTYESLFEG